jgi:type IV pilus assembly protein PilA
MVNRKNLAKDCRKPGRRSGGFTLVELLIVVAIILIIAAIAIPNFLKAQQAANEASAAGTVRTIATAERMYAQTWHVGYALAIGNLGGALPCTASLTTACILDPSISGGNVKNGYAFTATGAGGAGTPASPYTTFETAGVPKNTGSTGQNTYCTDETGVIRYDDNGGPDPGTDTNCETLPAE